MSSEISTSVRRYATTPAGETSADTRAVAQEVVKVDSLQAWQLFVLAALACATALTFLARGQGVTVVVLGTLLMGATALVGIAALRAILPLVSSYDDRTLMIGHRTRAALEREKMLALRSIKELEFDRAMGKLSDSDWQEMSTRLRARAARLMRQLDAGAGYRDQIERELAKRLGEQMRDSQGPSDGMTDDRGPVGRMARPICAACSTANDADARFCKGCGQTL
jgi:hypothetical protein